MRVVCFVLLFNEVTNTESKSHHVHPQLPPLCLRLDPVLKAQTVSATFPSCADLALQQAAVTALSYFCEWGIKVPCSCLLWRRLRRLFDGRSSGPQRSSLQPPRTNKTRPRGDATAPPSHLTLRDTRTNVSVVDFLNVNKLHILKRRYTSAHLILHKFSFTEFNILGKIKQKISKILTHN